MRPVCNDFPKRLVDVAHSECEVIQLLPFAIASEELALGRIPVELQSLCRGGTLQLDPHPPLVDPPPPRDLHAHHLSVEFNGTVEISDPNPPVEKLREKS